MTMNTIARGLDFLEVFKIRIFSVFFKKLQFSMKIYPLNITPWKKSENKFFWRC